MKFIMKKLFLFTIIFVFLLSALSAQTNNLKKDPVGNWLFEAPYAPEGYRNGVINLVKTENKLSATMAFGSGENKFTGDKVKIENDTISFTVYIEGQEVAVKLAFIEESKMTGKAVYTEGTVPLLLSREMKKN
jgi:hypothetical protein